MKKRWIVLFLSVLLFLAGFAILHTPPPSQTFAVNNYYVRADGNDGNNGLTNSAGGAWKTIAHAVTAASMGTSGTVTFGTWLSVPNCGIGIHVIDGTYAGGITTTRSGGATTRICIGSENKWGAKLTSPAWNQSGSYVTIVGFDMTGPGNYAFNITASHDSYYGYNNIHDFALTGCPANGVISEMIEPVDNNTFNGNIIRHFGSNTSTSPLLHGMYLAGGSPTVTNNFISGGACGWAHKQNLVAGHCAPGIISNNTYVDNAGGLSPTENTDAGPQCSFDYWSINANIIVNNGVPGTVNQRGGIHWYHVGQSFPACSPNCGTHNLASGNMIYNNKPYDDMHHDAGCGTNATATTPATGVAVPGGGVDAGCPITNSKTEFGVNTTFSAWHDDTNTSPDPNFDITHYSLKSGSAAIGAAPAPTTCAASPGMNPCAPSIDMMGLTRAVPASLGALEYGGVVGLPRVTPSTVSFGSIPVGTSAPRQQFTFTNNSSATVHVTAVTSSNATDFPINANGCGTEPAGNTCPFWVDFIPKSAGAKTSTISVSGPDFTTLTIAVSGTGTVAGLPSFAATTLDFGSVPVGASVTRSFTLNNPSNGVALTGLSLALTTGTQWAIQSNGCGSTLAAPGSCGGVLQFHPTSTGAKTDTLTATSSASNSPTIALTGTGAAAVSPGANPQTSNVVNTEPLYGINSKWVNGIAPGYWARAGGGLVLNLTQGSVNCAGVTTGYSGGTLTMTASSTNYVYLDHTNNCAPTVSTTAPACVDIPIATVTTDGSKITAIVDNRSPFNYCPVASNTASSIEDEPDNAGAACIGNCWKWTHDEGTPDTASATSSLVTVAPGTTCSGDSATVEGTARRFNITWTGYGGLRASSYLGLRHLNGGDSAIVIDGWFCITDLTHIAQLEIDLNLVQGNGDVVIFGNQCNFAFGKWDYTTNVSGAHWNHSNITCTKPSTNVWHHVIIRGHRFGGTVIYDSYQLDATTTTCTACSGNALFDLSWSPNYILVANFQMNGDGTSGTTTAYIDAWNIRTGQ